MMIVSAVAVQHVHRAALEVALQVGTSSLRRTEARAKVVVHMASVLRLVAARAHTFVAEEAVLDVVRSAHMCGAAGGVGEMLGAFDAGESVRMPLTIAVLCHGAVCSCASRRKLWRQGEFEAGHGCEVIFSVGKLIWCFPV